MILSLGPEAGAVTPKMLALSVPSVVALVCYLAAAIPGERFASGQRRALLVGWIAQGLSIDAIARRLVISLHTARDHVKRIQAKVRVTSRAELVSKLYVEHYAPATA